MSLREILAKNGIIADNSTMDLYDDISRTVENTIVISMDSTLPGETFGFDDGEGVFSILLLFFVISCV